MDTPTATPTSTPEPTSTPAAPAWNRVYLPVLTYWRD
jgi:hypothetical protein